MKSLVSRINQDIAGIAGRLLNTRVKALRPARPSGNNRVFRIETSDGVYAAKSYGHSAAEAAPRLATEYSALLVLSDAGGMAIPKPIARDDQAHIGIYEWVPGEPVSSIGPHEISAASQFVTRLSEVSAACTGETIGPAREACFSGEEIVRQIGTRIERLATAADSSALTEFLENAMAPVLAMAKTRGCDGLGDAAFSADVPIGRRVLSPSDFGLHNALRRRDGSIVFIDFEYFGWDDPVRLTADFLLHPGMDIAPGARTIFSRKMKGLFGHRGDDDYDFTSRLDLLYPLVGLRWCAILMNEFLPERWARRVFAGEKRDREAVLQDQLDKAHRMLDRVRDALEGYADGK